MSTSGAPLGVWQQRSQKGILPFGLIRSGSGVHRALAYAAVALLMTVEGVAITESYRWALVLPALLLVVVAADLPVIGITIGMLAIRALTDPPASDAVRETGTINSSAIIAALLTVVALGVLLRHRRGAGFAFVAAAWLMIWTLVAVRTFGLSSVAVREGVRELSIVAVGVIMYATPGVKGLSTGSRAVQIIAFTPALVALQQLATHTGMDIDGQIRANATFSHPNSAAFFFAIACVGSMWRYLDLGRRWADAALTLLFAGATIATFSIGGLAAMTAMLVVFGVLRRGTIGGRLVVLAAAVLLVLAFAATPLGAQRLQSQQATQIGVSYTADTSSNSLEWRLYNWGTLLPLWRQSPFLGHGLGTTLTGETLTGRIPHNEYLRYLVETGLIGVAVLGFGMIMLLRRLGGVRRNIDTRSDGALALAVVAGFAVDSLASNTLLYTPAAYIGVVLIACAMRPRDKEPDASVDTRVSGPKRLGTAT
jgi:O-antigen ligase